MTRTASMDGADPRRTDVCLSVSILASVMARSNATRTPAAVYRYKH